MNRFFTVFLFSLLVQSGEALAVENPYLGVDLAQVSFDSTELDVSVPVARARLGTELSSMIGMEFQAAMALQEEEVDHPAGKVTVEPYAILGYYLRGKLALSDSVALYGVGGYSWSQVRYSPNIKNYMKSKRNYADVSGGVGLEMKVFGKNYLSVDYHQYTEGLSAVGAGIRIPF